VGFYEDPDDRAFGRRQAVPEGVEELPTLVVLEFLLTLDGPVRIVPDKKFPNRRGQKTPPQDGDPNKDGLPGVVGVHGLALEKPFFGEEVPYGVGVFEQELGDDHRIGGHDLAAASDEEVGPGAAPLEVPDRLVQNPQEQAGVGLRDEVFGECGPVLNGYPCEIDRRVAIGVVGNLGLQAAQGFPDGPERGICMDDVDVPNGKAPLPEGIQGEGHDLGFDPQGSHQGLGDGGYRRRHQDPSVPCPSEGYEPGPVYLL